MRQRILMTILLMAAALEARAQSCFFAFPSLSTCSGSNCSILINVQPGGTVRVLPDSKYGNQLGINFGAQSVFRLGDNGRINFGNSGGIEAVMVQGSPFPACTSFNGGFQSNYVVEMGGGGWLDFSGNNRIELKANNVFALGGVSKIDGRLDIQSDGAVGIIVSGDATLPNVDLDAQNGITLSGQGDIQIGNLTNQGAPADNQGININANGDVTIGIVEGTGDFSVMAGGNISIGEIRNADSIALMIAPPATGIIRIGGTQTTDSQVLCAPTDDCSGFELAGGGSGGGGVNDCNTVSSDPSVSNDCGGGATGPGFTLLCLWALFRRRPILRR